MVEAPAPHFQHNISRAYRRDDSPDRLQSISLSAATLASLGHQRESSPEATPSLSRFNYDRRKPRSDLIEQAIPYFDKAEQTGFTNAEVIIQGLNFMMRAAGLGNEDAVTYLNDFVNNLIYVVIPEDGPTYHTIRSKVDWIRKFLELSEHNRLLWKASLENFLIMSSHRKTLEKSRFDEAVYSLMEEMDDVQDKGMLSAVQRGLLRSAVHYSPRPDEVTEEAYCWTVIQYTEGELTIDFGPEDMNEEQLEKFNKASILEKLLKYPMKKSLQFIAKEEMPKYANRQGTRIMRGFVPSREIFLFMAALFAVSLNKFIAVAAFCVFWPCLVALIVATFLLLSNQDKSKGQFDAWVRYLTRKRGVHVDPSSSEVHQLVHLTSYYVIIFGLFSLLLITFHAAKDIIFLPEVLVGVSGVMFLACCLIRKFWRKRIIVALALAVKMAIMLASMFDKLLPLFIKSLPNLLPAGVSDSGVFTFLYSNALSLHTLVSGVMYFVVFVPLTIIHVVTLGAVVMQCVSGGKMYTFTIGGPYFVSSLWWLLWMVFFHFLVATTTSGEAINWTWLSVSHVPFLLPGVLLMKLLHLAILYGIQILIGFVVVIVIAVAAFSCFHFGAVLAKVPYIRLVTFDHLIILTIVVVPLVLLMGMADIYTVTNKTPPPAPLKWQDYCAHCGPHKWEETNMAEVQYQCANLIGRRAVNLVGKVKTVRVVKRQNVYESIFDKFSFFGHLKEAGYCYFGTSKGLCGGGAEDLDPPTSDTACGENPCNLHSHDSFTFIIGLTEVQDALSTYNWQCGVVHVGLSAEHAFKDLVFALRSSVVITFNATLIDGLGSDEVSMKAEAIAITEKAELRHDAKEWAKQEAAQRYSAIVGLAIRMCKQSLNHLQTFVLGEVYYEV